MSLASQSLFEVVRRPIMTTPASTTVVDALALTSDKRIHHLPVLLGEVLVGLVCTCDMYEARLDALVSDIMRKDVVTLSHDATLKDAALLMKSRRVGSVVVLREGLLAGIVTRGDLLAGWPSSEAVLGPSRCECCGLTRHLKSNPRGQTLCIYCDERVDDGSWFDLGVGD